MKIALIESPHIEQILRIQICLERMGHDVMVHFIRDYKQRHSYLEKNALVFRIRMGSAARVSMKSYAAATIWGQWEKLMENVASNDL